MPTFVWKMDSTNCILKMGANIVVTKGIDKSQVLSYNRTDHL
jgi:hypothetical protein